MLLMMPVMIGWMSLNFPSGLVIYWIVCNLYQLVQQTIMYWGEMKERIGGKSSKGTLTVHGENQPKAEVKKKKIIRKKVIKKVVKKPADAPKDENKEASPSKAEAPEEVKDPAGDEKPAKAEVPAKSTGEADEK